MYIVHWKNYLNDVENIHGKYNTLEDAISSIHDWWDKNNFSPPYIRVWTTDNITNIDYGSHFCFYEIHKEEK